MFVLAGGHARARVQSTPVRLSLEDLDTLTEGRTFCRRAPLQPFALKRAAGGGRAKDSRRGSQSVSYRPVCPQGSDG